MYPQLQGAAGPARGVGGGVAGAGEDVGSCHRPPRLAQAGLSSAVQPGNCRSNIVPQINSGIQVLFVCLIMLNLTGKKLHAISYPIRGLSTYHKMNKTLLAYHLQLSYFMTQK